MPPATPNSAGLLCASFMDATLAHLVGLGLGTAAHHCRSSQAGRATQNLFNLSAACCTPYIIENPPVSHLFFDIVNPSVTSLPTRLATPHLKHQHTAIPVVTFFPALCTISYCISPPRYPYSSLFSAQFSYNWDCQELQLLINHISASSLRQLVVDAAITIHNNITSYARYPPEAALTFSLEDPEILR